MKVVLDTNLLIGALANEDSLGHALYHAWRTGRFTLLSSEAQLAELRRVSRRPKFKGVILPHQAGALVNLIRREALMLTPESIPDVSPDPDDNFIVAIAVAGRADYLASLDRRHVLILKKVGKTKIVQPGTLLKKLS